ncbi:general secretion pathway protein D [Inhella inkyongensis]|uniref:General secretion pathway protein D n=1 Tax=Inhella inkyongensis TaxID=392593 RepID=A0A840S0G3_9BURK|nr:type II secretion system secretin GspD [Inhella inkyongensis]MBB5203273.1 general secretion pathway protein D [Inhella inkyongensis]
MDFPLFRATALAATLCLHAGFAHAAPPAVRAETPVTLNFVNADIEAVSRAMGSMLGRSLIVDPRVKGTVTLYSEQPLRAQEAFAQYLAALRGLGFSVIDAAGLLKVVPEADAKLQATTVVLDDSKIRGDQIITQVFQLKHENANNLVAVLRPLVNVNNTINANPGNNSLVITDYADNLKRIAKIIAALDTGAATDVEVLVLQHAVATDVAALLQKLGEGGSGAGAPQGGPATTQVVAEPRNNSLILRAPNAARLAALKALAQKLDRPASNAAGGIHVVHLKNADATKLAQVLRAAFAGTGSGNSNSAGLAAFAQSTSPAPQQAQPISTQPGGANSGANSAAAATPVAASAQPSTGGFIQADPATNSLIITAADPLYRQMRAVIDQLDGRRAQIYVETMIVKVDASRGAQFGVQWQNLFGDKGDSAIGGAGTNFGTGGANIINLSAAAAKGRDGAAAVLGQVPGGLNLGFLKKIGDFYTLGALANFLESETGANILSTPNLVALDNEEAKIVVGQNVPFVTGSFTNTGAGAGAGGAVNPFQTVERKDVGLVLRVKAQIGEGGSIRMVIYHENSSVVPGGSQSTGPITDKNAIETTVTVDDGGLLVLGGLIKDEYTDGNDGVPGLSKIPLIGHLFKSENRKRQRTNLMVFLRPTVLRTAEDADRMTLNRYDQIRAFQDKAQPASSLLLPDTGAPQLPPTPAKSGQTGPKAD